MLSMLVASVDALAHCGPAKVKNPANARFFARHT